MDPDHDANEALPRREPRPLVVHALIDTAVVFLLSVVLLLIFDIDLLTVVAIAAVVGALVAPLTRRAEIRALAARPENGLPRPDADPRRPA